MRYDSTERVPSKLQEGVVYEVARMSFGRRVELMRRIRELAPRIEFHQAGGTDRDGLEASVLAADVDRTYLVWGLKGIHGLLIDGEAATPESLCDTGPEELFFEAVDAVKELCQLNESARKN